MALLRQSGPYVWVTWLTKLLVGDASCEWAAWFKAQHEGFSWEKVPDSIDWTPSRIEHTAMVAEVREQLEEEGYAVFTESQNSFALKGRSTSITLGGRPDLVARRGGEGIIVEVKSGVPRPSHHIQLLTYMYAVARAPGPHVGVEFEGKLVYSDHEVPVPSVAVDEAFVANLGGLIRRVGADTPSRKVPSPDECRFCNITIADCPERDAEGTVLEGETDDF